MEDDITIEILKEIRDEIRATNGRLDETALDETRTEMSDRFERLEHRQVVTETRIATELIAVAGAVNALREDLREDRALRRRVDEHERRIQTLERQAG